MFKSHLTSRPVLHGSNDNMQRLLTRRVLGNLTTNTLPQLVKSRIPTAAASLSKLPVSGHSFASDCKEQKLLRFPAIQLEETIPKFLKTVEPLLDECELESTRAAAQRFHKNEGNELQRLLEEVAACEENWLAPRWLKVAYLRYRDPVTVYSSPGMTFPVQQFASPEDYYMYTAKVIHGLIKYKADVDGGRLPVVKMGKLELDNSQFHVVYGTCRIPRPCEDALEYNPNSQHVAVIHKNHFYKLPVYNKKCKPLTAKVLAEQLKKIACCEDKAGTPYGILTTDTRDNWAEAYAELIKSKTNLESIRVIQQSLFTVSLDTHVAAAKEDYLNVLGTQLIHGGGSDKNSANRWMDKTIQVVVNPNGMSGFCYEHSPAEGQPIALMADFIAKILPDEKLFEDGASDDYESFEALPFEKPSQKLATLLEAAKKNVDRLATDLQLSVLHYKDYGKEFLKQQKLSPDSYIQMALQYAFYKMHKTPGAQYESAHLRIYYGGRTETIRSCSNESVAFAKAMCDAKASDEQRVELLRKAVNSHRAYTTMALQGRGVDRHLLGLKLMAMENKKPIPEFYKTAGFVKSSHFRVSTSQVASANEAFMCYGPLTHDGYGCCYNPRSNDIILACSAWKSNDVTCAERFSVALSEALTSMRELLERAGEKPKAKL